MNHLHPAIALVLFLEAFGAFWLLNRWFRLAPAAGHTPEIDGLRGLLAFGVFVHHASIWYFFLQTGAWVVPESRLYTHLGQSTVSLFFMITGFLFFGKLAQSRSAPIDWLRLYVSRCLRILPLYLLVMLVGAVLIALIRHSGWVAGLPPPWDQKSLTGLFTAGVTWTLSYEWKFYYALPLWALLLGRVPLPWLLFSGGLLLLSGAGKSLDIHALTFLGGGVALLLRRWAWWVRLARSGWGSTLAIIGLVVVVAGFDTAYAAWPLAWSTLAFALIANGAGLWGILTAALSRVFGEITYSIYLLHGPLLFVVFKFVIGFEVAAGLSPATYWMLVAALVPVLLFISAFTYRWIEQPCMRWVSASTDWLRRHAVLWRGFVK